MSPQKSSQIENFAALNRLCHPGLTFGILCYWRIFVYKYIWLHKNWRHKPAMMSLEFSIFAFGHLRASWEVECLTVVETQINTFPQSACPQTPSRTWQTSFNWKSEQLLFHWSFHLSMYWGCHYPILRCVSSDMMIIFCKNSWKPQTKKDISWSSQSLSFSFLVEIFVIMVLSSLVLFSSIERKVSDTRRKP